MTSSGSTVTPWIRWWWPAIFSRSSRIPADGVYPSGFPDCSSRTASSRTGTGAPVLGWPARRSHRSPCVRWRRVAAASRSITWKGGMLARLATWNLSLTGPT